MGFPNEPVARSTRPRVKPRVKKLFRIEGATRISGVIVCPKVWGFESHWNAGTWRTEPCNGDKHSCEGCLAKLPGKQFGVIEVYSIQTQGTVFVQLTPGAWDELEGLAHDGNLRGLHVILQRRSSKPKQPIIIDVIGYDELLEKLPVPTDPMTTLKRVWGLD